MAGSKRNWDRIYHSKWTVISSTTADIMKSSRRWVHIRKNTRAKAACILPSGRLTRSRSASSVILTAGTRGKSDEPLADSGIWEAFVPGIATGELYKYAITTKSGKILFKADPYAFSAEYRPGTASVTTDISGFQWSDDAWMENGGAPIPERANKHLRGSPWILAQEKQTGERRHAIHMWKLQRNWRIT